MEWHEVDDPDLNDHPDSNDDHDCPACDDNHDYDSSADHDDGTSDHYVGGSLYCSSHNGDRRVRYTCLHKSRLF